MDDKRFSILIVEDEYFHLVLADLCRLGFVNGMPGSIPNVNDFNILHDRSRDLVNVYAVGGADTAIQVFKDNNCKIDLAVIDVNLSGDINDGNKNDEFGGFRAYREMCRLKYQMISDHKTFFIIYTRDPKVLSAYDYLSIKNVSDIKLLSRIIRPVIIAFGEKERSDLWSQPAAPGESQVLGELVYLHMIEEHLTQRSREIVKTSKQRQEIKQLLSEVEALAEDEISAQAAIRRLGLLELEGWQFKHLYPVDFTRIIKYKDSQHLRVLLQKARRKIFLGFRHQLRELEYRINNIGHRINNTSWKSMQVKLTEIIDDLSDICHYNLRFQKTWEDLVKATNRDDDGEDYGKWRTMFSSDVSWYFRDVVNDLLDQNITLSWLCSSISSMDDKSDSYFMWRPDFEAALQVIIANARSRGWGKGRSTADLIKARWGGESYSSTNFWLDFQTDDKPMSEEDTERLIQSSRHTFDFDRFKERLPELVYIVCECYGGSIEVISRSDSDKETRLQKVIISNSSIVERKNFQASEGEQHFVGTKYRLIFPKGADDVDIDFRGDEIESQPRMTLEEISPAPERIPPIGFVDIMIADDNGYDPLTIKVLRKMGYNVGEPALNIEEASSQLNLFKPSVVLADLHFPSGEAGKELLRLALSAESVRLVIAISRARAQHGELPLGVEDCCGGVDYRDPERIHRLIWRRAALNTVENDSNYSK